MYLITLSGSIGANTLFLKDSSTAAVVLSFAGISVTISIPFDFNVSSISARSILPLSSLCLLGISIKL